MGMLRNAKHEKFAQQLAKGDNMLSAYVLAGYEENWPNASRLAKHDKIRQRIDEILTRRDESMIRAEAKAFDAVAVDKKWIMKRLVGLADRSQASRDSRGEAKALELLGKECGMFIQRIEAGTPGSFDALDTTQAILDAVRQQLGAEYADAMAALLDKNRAAKVKVIEHQPSESEQDPQVIDGEVIGD